MVIVSIVCIKNANRMPMVTIFLIQKTDVPSNLRFMDVEKSRSIMEIKAHWEEKSSR